VTTAEAAALLDVPEDQVRIRMHRYARQQRVLSPARGLWVIIPPEFRTWGTLPALQLIDPLMRHLGHDYYVGWLSAAELHGAAHQRPQALQVAVDTYVADRDFGRARIDFAIRKRVGSIPRLQHTVPTGTVWVSSPEATALDLADEPAISGGLSNVATVLAELGADSTLDSQRLADATASFPLATVRRLGYLLDVCEMAELAQSLRPVADTRRRYPVSLLSPDGPVQGPVNSNWRLQVNTTVEPDQ
jgi:predicted transcriptional regulator of viral defense system